MHVLPGLTVSVYASFKSMEVTHYPACKEVLIVSGVSILNDSVRGVVQGTELQDRSSNAYWVWEKFNHPVVKD